MIWIIFILFMLQWVAIERLSMAAVRQYQLEQNSWMLTSYDLVNLKPFDVMPLRTRRSLSLPR